MSAPDPPVVRLDPKTGVRIGPATPEEAALYWAQPTRFPAYRLAFRRPIRAGPYLLDVDTGPGIWFGGAGF